MPDQVKAMLGSWARVFLISAITAFLAMQTPPWELSGDQWLAVLWAAILSILPVIVNWLNPGYIMYGNGSVSNGTAGSGNPLPTEIGPSTENVDDLPAGG